ncbi:hypothetical protein EDD18DRAFT_1182756 [Armillaria luteobubalina]|uniref:Uncharacterized protein n=1 Tax=Armillaria luteobubalina TaxID=153913 RepID=A0AA39PY86_9AGAR|nr:hypothetical protein EDD18DRAFT_1182756 [Armillaria luteobubalina]
MPSENVDPRDLEGDPRLHWWHSWAPWFALVLSTSKLVYETEGEYTELTLSLLPAMKFREQDTDPSPYAYIEGDVHPQGALVEPEQLKPTFPNSGRKKLMENCILPILDILDVELESFYFAVMPKFVLTTYQIIGSVHLLSGGILPRYTVSGFLGVVLAYMHCMLKSLRYVHSKNIIHRVRQQPVKGSA